MKKVLYSIAASSALFTGCLKDDSFDEKKSGYQSNNSDRFVTIMNAYELAGLHTTDLLTTPAEEQIAAFTVSLTGPAYDKDVQITLSYVPDLVEDYNENNTDQFETLPAANFELPTTATIPAGKDYAVVKFKLKKGGLDPVVPYAIGIKITAVSDPSIKLASNTRQSLLGILFRNDYDGEYEWRGETFHPTNAAFVGRIKPVKVGLLTIGATSVETTITHPWANGQSTPTDYNVTFTVNPTTNAVTVTNGRGFTFENSPGYNSRYDPTTKTIYAKWQYLSSGGNRVFTDTLVYLGIR